MALLGAVAWRVYDFVLSADKRRHKTEWTPPRRYSISELARAAASGRDGRPNRNQISGRNRRVDGRPVWQPGAFDRLVAKGIARIQWHDGSPTPFGCAWQPWVVGGEHRQRALSGPGRSTLRLVYRISVVTDLPLLTPHQIARLPAEHQVAHKRYLHERGLDPLVWEQITLPTLAPASPAPCELGSLPPSTNWD